MSRNFVRRTIRRTTCLIVKSSSRRGKYFEVARSDCSVDPKRPSFPPWADRQRSVRCQGCGCAIPHELPITHIYLRGCESLSQCRYVLFRDRGWPAGCLRIIDAARSGIIIPHVVAGSMFRQISISAGPLVCARTIKPGDDIRKTSEVNLSRLCITLIDTQLQLENREPLCTPWLASS